MVDEGRGEYASSRPWEDGAGRAIGTVVATAVAAGVIAFILRRITSRGAVADQRQRQLAKICARMGDARTASKPGRDFLMDKIVPELKPALLSALSEIEDIVDQAFRRIERNIKKM